MNPTRESDAETNNDSLATRWNDKSAIRSFEAEVRRQENLLFGVTLFFEGIHFLYAGQDATLETYRKELRNIMGIGRQRLDDARKLLEAARKDSSRVSAIRDFRFQACQGASHPAELTERAEILARTYDEIFARRSRETPLSEDEMERLLTAASDKIPLPM